MTVDLPIHYYRVAFVNFCTTLVPLYFGVDDLFSVSATDLAVASLRDPTPTHCKVIRSSSTRQAVRRTNND